MSTPVWRPSNPDWPNLDFLERHSQLIRSSNWLLLTITTTGLVLILLALAAYLANNQLKCFSIGKQKQCFFFNWARTSTCSRTQTSWTVQETHKRSALMLNFDQIGFKARSSNWPPPGSPAVARHGVDVANFIGIRKGGGDQGDQTGAKQIIGRLQVGKTIGQLD